MKTIIEERTDSLDKVLDYLSEYLVITKDLILVNKAEEYVNARYVLIRILCDKFSDKEVSTMTGLTKAGVNAIKNKFQHKPFLNDLYLKLKVILLTYFE